MRRKTFDKIVTFVGFGLSALLLVLAGLLNWGATFAQDSVKSQLENQNISFPEAEAMPPATKDQLTKWAGMQVTTGEMARDYADLYIWEHMKGAAKAGVGCFGICHQQGFGGFEKNLMVLNQSGSSLVRMLTSMVIGKVNVFSRK